jgi:hypothetical protein
MLKKIVDLFCKIDRKFIVDCIVIAIPIILIFIYFNLKPSGVNETLKANKKIEEKIDSIRLYNEELSTKIGELEQNQILFNDIIAQNNLLIQENNKELAKLKRIYNDKINSVSRYNVAQLDSFFSSRYKEKYNR